MNHPRAFLLLALLSTAVACAHASEVSAPNEGTQSSDPAYLFVQSAQSVQSTTGSLTLKGVSPTTVYFTDRPQRTAGHSRTVDFVSHWAQGEDSFRADPPNATLSVLGSDEEVTEVVVTLSNPRLDGQNLTYDVKTLEGNLPEAGGAAALFIDILVVHAPLVRVPRAVVMR